MTSRRPRGQLRSWRQRADGDHGRHPQGPLGRHERRRAGRTGSSPDRTSTWRRSTPASSTRGARRRGSSPAPRRAGSDRRCAGPTTSAATWQETPGGGVRFPDDVGGSVERVWQLVPGHDADSVWAGTEPGAVWRSSDRGATFELVRSLWEHPHRTEWGEGFGGQAFHTILPHPDDAESVTVAISTGGVYQTADGGEALGAAQPRHPRGVPARGPAVPGVRAVRAQGDPAPVAPRAALPAEPRRRLPLRRPRRRLGVHRRRAARRLRLPGRGAPARAGHGLRVPDPGRRARYPPDAEARVWRSRDAGETWEALGDGLPDGVLRRRHARRHVCRRPRVRRGSTSAPATARCGPRPTAGDSWRQIVANLPDVMVVRAARLAPI